MNALGNLHLDATIPVTVAATSLKVMRVSDKTPFLLRRGYEDLCKALRCLSVCSYVLSCALSCALLFALPCAPDALLRSWARNAKERWKRTASKAYQTTLDFSPARRQNGLRHCTCACDHFSHEICFFAKVLSPAECALLPFLYALQMTLNPS